MKSLAYKDFTIKATLKNSEAIEAAIQEMNAMFVGLDTQTDHYFSVSKGKLKLREGVIENLITHYERVFENGLERTIVYRYEINPSKSQIDELFGKYTKIGTTQKERKIYKIDLVKIHLDRLPDGMEFIEIEAMDINNDFSIQELQEHCLSMKLKLGLPDNSLIQTGYLI